MGTPFVGHIPLNEVPSRLVEMDRRVGPVDAGLLADLLPMFGAEVVWRGRARFVAEADLADLLAWVWIWRQRLRRPKRKRRRP
jgi:hypothetical protein